MYPLRLERKLHPCFFWVIIITAISAFIIPFCFPFVYLIIRYYRDPDNYWRTIAFNNAINKIGTSTQTGWSHDFRTMVESEYTSVMKNAGWWMFFTQLGTLHYMTDWTGVKNEKPE
jgi:hypothetical protein